MVVPANETRRLHALFAGLRDEPESRKLPADYQDKLRAAIAETDALDAAVRSGDVAEAGRRFGAVKASCKACHKDYRDR